MVRGRKREITQPGSRSAALQREYREKKAQYIADLEERCSSLEEQNARLAKEVVDLRDSNPVQKCSSCSRMDTIKAETFDDVLSSLTNAMDTIRRIQRAAHPVSTNPQRASAPNDSAPFSSPYRLHSFATFPGAISSESVTSSSVMAQQLTSPSPHSSSSSHMSTPVSSYPDSRTKLLAHALSRGGSEEPYGAPEYWDKNSNSCCMGFFSCDAIEQDKGASVSDSAHAHSYPHTASSGAAAST